MEVISTENICRGVNQVYSVFSFGTFSIQQNHVYGFVLASKRVRSIFAVKVVGIGADSSATVQYAIKDYEELGIFETSSGFSWNATNQFE